MHLHPCPCIGLPLYPRTRLAQAWLRIHRHHPHLPQHAPHPLGIDQIALMMQPGSHAQHPIKGATCVLLIEHAHPVQVLDARVHGLVVPA